MNRNFIILILFTYLLFGNIVFAKSSNFSKQVFFQDLEKEKVQIYFVDPLKNKRPKNACENEACLSLLYLIENAKESIDFAIYGIGGQDAIFNALVDAQKRGVKVRGVVDATQDNKNIYKDTEKLIIKLKSIKNDYLSPTDMRNPYSRNFKFDITKAIMHNKFFIIDNQYIWTGSTNVSNTCMNYNSNNVLVIKSNKIADLFKKEFSQMYEEELFHDRKNIVSNNEDIVLCDDLEVTVFFLPVNNPIEQAINPLIRNAKSSIDIEIFYLTHRGIIYELINAHKRGIKIRVILDASSASNEFSKFYLLRKAGIPVKIENWGGKMHKKSMIIDNKYIIVGSMNWTTSAQYHNDENVIVIKNENLAQKAENDFNYLWNSIPEKWLTGIPESEGLDSPNSCNDGIDNNHDGKTDKEDINCKFIKF